MGPGPGSLQARLSSHRVGLLQFIDHSVKSGDGDSIFNNPQASVPLETMVAGVTLYVKEDGKSTTAEDSRISSLYDEIAEGFVQFVQDVRSGGLHCY